MNTETLMTDLWRKKRRLTDADGRAQRRRGSLGVQGDAAAGVEAEAKVDGGGGAPKVGQRKEEDEVKRYGGEWKDPLALFIRAER